MRRTHINANQTDLRQEMSSSSSSSSSSEEYVTNWALTPHLMWIFQPVNKDGQVVYGQRRHPRDGGGAEERQRQVQPEDAGGRQPRPLLRGNAHLGDEVKILYEYVGSVNRKF